MSAREEKNAFIQMGLNITKVLAGVGITQKERGTVLFLINTMKTIGLNE